MRSFFSTVCLSGAVLALSACGGSSSDNHAATDNTPASAEPEACRVVRPDDDRGGRNVLLRCDGRQVMASRQMQEHMDPAVRVRFDKGGKVIKANLQTRQAANATGRSDDVACQRAFVNAVVKFQETAKKMGGSGVSNFHSYLDRNVLKNGEYECEAGTFHARVLMRGDVVR